MITGTVNDNLEAIVRLTVRDAAGYPQEVELLLDTGFTGPLALPAALISSLGLARHSSGTAVLANGSLDSFDIYPVEVDWDGSPRRTLVQALGGVPLLGMELLVGHDVRIRAEAGGNVQIEAIP